MATEALEHLIRCTLKAGKPVAARKYLYMLQSVYPDPERLKIYALQVQIAENKEKKTKQQEES